MLLKPQVLCRMMVVVLKMMRVGFEAKGVGTREGKSSAAYKIRGVGVPQNDFKVNGGGSFGRDNKTIIA